MKELKILGSSSVRVLSKHEFCSGRVFAKYFHHSDFGRTSSWQIKLYVIPYARAVTGAAVPYTDPHR